MPRPCDHGPAPRRPRSLRTKAAGGGVMEINGLAPVMLAAVDFARSRTFYQALLPFLGLRPVIDSAGWYYCVGGRTAFGIRECAPEHRGERFVQQRVGLHHVCFRARERADI